MSVSHISCIHLDGLRLASWASGLSFHLLLVTPADFQQLTYLKTAFARIVQSHMHRFHYARGAQAEVMQRVVRGFHLYREVPLFLPDAGALLGRGLPSSAKGCPDLAREGATQSRSLPISLGFFTEEKSAGSFAGCNYSTSTTQYSLHAVSNKELGNRTTAFLASSTFSLPQQHFPPSPHPTWPLQLP